MGIATVCILKLSPPQYEVLLSDWLKFCCITLRISEKYHNDHLSYMVQNVDA